MWTAARWILESSRDEVEELLQVLVALHDRNPRDGLFVRKAREVHFGSELHDVLSVGIVIVHVKGNLAFANRVSLLCTQCLRITERSQMRPASDASAHK